MCAYKIFYIFLVWIFSFNCSFSQEIDLIKIDNYKNNFIEHMVENYNFKKDELDIIFNDVEILHGVLDSISNPAERVIPWYEYKDIFLTDRRIELGVDFWLENYEIISSVSQSYDIPPEIIVSILGIETYYGRYTGEYSVLDSLFTLAFAYPPRSQFFLNELESFLLLTREEEIDPFLVRGSYAGAMGNSQFISSSYRAYAVDGDGDGKRDLWNSLPDIISSICNYFSVHGWQKNGPIFEKAYFSNDNNVSVESNSLVLEDTIESLHAEGYVFSSDLPVDSPVTPVILSGDEGIEYWIGFRNFYVITRYNRSEKYAMATYQLAEAIKTQFEFTNK